MFELQVKKKRSPLFWITILGILFLVIFLVYRSGQMNFFASTFNTRRTVTLETSEGNIEITLFDDKTPNLADNFYWLAKSGKYNNTIFHRVINGFMIQGGDFEFGDGRGGKGFRKDRLPDEFSEGLSHRRAMVSMANLGPDTNASQFFIVQKDAEFLDGKHSIFGEVTRGMDVVDRIALVKVGEDDRPLQDVLVKRAIVRP